MPPLLIRNALHPDALQPLLLVDGDTVHMPTPPLLDVLGDFASDGNGGLIAPARASSGWGYIDGRGRWIVAPTLQSARSFSVDGLARFQVNELWGYLDPRGGVVIPPRFVEAGAFRHGLAPVLIGEQWRYIDRSGAFSFDAAFAEAGAFSEVGLAVARRKPTAPFGFIDTTGAWAIAPRFSYTPGFTRHGLAAAALERRQYGVIDTTGAWVVEPNHDDIDSFNEAGYAYCSDGYDRTSFLDTAGHAAIPTQGDLDRYMVDGLVLRNHYRFVGLSGELSTSVKLEWAARFNGHGFTVARASTALPDDPDGREQPWGVLRADGQFRCAPGGVLEPLTDAEREIVLPEPGTPLVPFLTREQEVVLLDKNGSIAYRLQREPAGDMEVVALRDASGRTLWRGEPVEATARPGRFLDPVPEQFLEGLTDPAQVTALAEAMLAQTRDKLAQLTTGALRRTDVDIDEGCDGNDEEDEHPSEQDGYDLADPGGPAAAVRTSRRVFRVYLDEPTWGTYHYLSEWHMLLMKRMHEDLVARLSASFGPRTIAPDYAVRGAGMGTSAWAFGEEPQRLWVGIKSVFDTAGGACWCNIWLHCAPSLATLKAALAASPVSWEGADGGAAFDEEALGMTVPYADAPLRNHHAWVAEVGGYDDWLREVAATPEHIAHVPAAYLDDAMVDAALTAAPAAYHHVPTVFHTPARLEALIRKGVDYAVAIPPSCMTAEGLALARALYKSKLPWKKTQPWQQTDKRHSTLPQRPLNSASLTHVWGCLVDAEMAMEAVRAGADLLYVPRWLRSAALIETALEDDIGNLRWLDRDQITPAMAEQAVRTSYSDLMAYIPKDLLTPERCLAAAQSGGLLEFVPPELITVPLCVAALKQSRYALQSVPHALRAPTMAALAQDSEFWYDFDHL